MNLRLAGFVAAAMAAIGLVAYMSRGTGDAHDVESAFAVDLPTVDFDVVLPTDRLIQTVSWKSGFSEVANVGEITASCPCLQVEANASVVAPGEELRLTVKIVGVSTPGPFSHRFVVEFTDGQALLGCVRGVVLRPAVFKAPAVWISMDPGESVFEARNTLMLPTSSDSRIVEVRSHDPSLDVSLGNSSTTADAVETEIIVRGGAPNGVVATWWQIEADVEIAGRPSTMRFPVTVSITGRAVPSPSVVLMRGDPVTEARFYVHGEGAVDLNGCSVRTSPDNCAELAVDPSDQSVIIRRTEFTPTSFAIHLKLSETEITVPVHVVP